MNAFFQAIQTLFETTNTFNTALSGEFYYAEALGGSMPYAVYFGMPGIPEGTWSNDIDDVSFQVNCFASTASEAGELLTKCRSLFDGSSLTITGYQNMKLQIEMFTPPWRDGDRWVVSAEFQGYLIKE